MKLKMVATSVVLANMLLGQTDLGMLENFIGMAKSFPITGAYSSYDFDGDGKIDANDWVFKFVKYDGVYRLLGDKPTQSNLFGWKQVDIVPNEPEYFMIDLGDWDNDGDKKFDWLVLTADGKSIYKLDGVTDQNTFKYSKKLNTSFDIDLQNMMAYVKMPDMQTLPPEISGTTENLSLDSDYFNLTKFKDLKSLGLFEFGNIIKVIAGKNNKDEDRIYIADYYVGLKIFTAESEENVDLVSTFSGFNILNDIAKNGDYIYAVGIGGLKVIDISDEKNPKEIGSLADFSYPRTVNLDVSGNYLYVADSDLGLKIVDISDPKNPTLKGTLSTGGVIYSALVKDDIAYINDMDNGLILVDVSDKSNPKKIGELKLDGNSYFTALKDSFAFVTNGENGVKVVDVSDPKEPKLLTTIPVDGDSYDVKVAGNYLFVAEGDKGLKVVDISDPNSPKDVKSFKVEGWIKRVTIDKDGILYLAEGSSGVEAFEILEESSDSEVSNTQTSDTQATLADSDLKKFAYVLTKSQSLNEKSVEKGNDGLSQVSSSTIGFRLAKLTTREGGDASGYDLIFDESSGDYQLVSNEIDVSEEEIIVRYFNGKTGEKIMCYVQSSDCLSNEGLMTGSFEEMNLQPDFENILIQVEVKFKKPIEEDGITLKMEKIESNKFAHLADGGVPTKVTWRGDKGIITLEDGTSFDQEIFEITVDLLNADRYEGYTKISSTTSDGKIITGDVRFKDGEITGSNIFVDGKSYELKEKDGRYVIVDETGNEISLEE